MSYASCLAAARTLMENALPGFTTVNLRQDQPTPYTPAQYPMLLLDHGQAREKRLGLPIANSNSGGRKLRWWPLTAYLWNYEAGPTWDESGFLGYVEAAENAIRLNNRLFNSSLNVDADTATTFVLTAAENAPEGIGIQSRTEAIRDGTGGLTRYGEIVFLIREGVNG